jgi:ribosomal protein L30
MPKKAAGSTKKKATKAAKKTTAKKKTAKKAAKAPDAAPAKSAAKPAATKSGRVRVRQVRSGIGHAAAYRRTLRALGLKHHQDETVVPDNPSTRGMIHKVRHLVSVTPEEA